MLGLGAQLSHYFLLSKFFGTLGNPFSPLGQLRAAQGGWIWSCCWPCCPTQCTWYSCHHDGIEQPMRWSPSEPQTETGDAYPFAKLPPSLSHTAPCHHPWQWKTFIMNSNKTPYPALSCLSTKRCPRVAQDNGTGFRNSVEFINQNKPRKFGGTPGSSWLSSFKIFLSKTQKNKWNNLYFQGQFYILPAQFLVYSRTQ